MAQLLRELYRCRDYFKELSHFNIYGRALLNPVNCQALPITGWGVSGPAQSGKNNISRSGIIRAVVCKRGLKSNDKSTLVHINSHTFSYNQRPHLAEYCH